MSATCPYCRCEIKEEDERKDCPVCATPHHADCFAENGGCTLFGCSQAPAEEAKISLSAQELSSNYASGPAPPPGTMLAPAGASAAPAPAPPPPPPISTGIAPPPPMGGFATPPMYDPVAMAYQPRKSRVAFVVLGIFLGALGIHNYYAGYAKKGTWQLCISVMSCFWLSPVSWVWAIVEICAVNCDADGNPLV